MYSLEDLVNTSQEHRDRSLGGDTVALHVLALPGRYEIEGVPGAAFHEDPEHPGHTGEDDSVMYWAIESPSLTQLFRSGPPTTFTDADRREMEQIRQQAP